MPLSAATPPASAVRAKLLGLDLRYRYSAAFTHATGLEPWDPEVPRLYEVARDLDGRLEAAISIAVLTADLSSPDIAARRAGHVEAVVAALTGLEYDEESPRLAGFAEYARQLRAALAAREHGLEAQDTRIAAAARDIAGQVEDDGTGSICKHLTEAAAALDRGARAEAWHNLAIARRHAAGEHTTTGMMAPLADGTAAHEQVGALMEQLAPTAPPAGGGTFADLLHAGDMDTTAGKVVTHEAPRRGPANPSAVAVQGQLHKAAQALRTGRRDKAVTLLAAAREAACTSGTLIDYRSPGPVIDRHLARIEARLSGKRQAAGSYTEQAAGIACRMREADPDGPPPLVRVTSAGPARVMAADHVGRLFDVALTCSGTDDVPEVTVSLEGKSLTARVRSAPTELTARQLAGRLTGEWKTHRRAPRLGRR